MDDHRASSPVCFEAAVAIVEEMEKEEEVVPPAILNMFETALLSPLSPNHQQTLVSRIKSDQRVLKLCGLTPSMVSKD